MSIIVDNSCLSNIIGIETNCGGYQSTSGIYTSQVGITEKFISQIITSDFSGPLDFHRKKLDAAIDEVVRGIHTHLQPRYKDVSVIDNFKTGIFLENKVTVNPSNTYKGILFDLNSERSYLDFFASKIELFVNYTGQIPLLIVDLLEGRILDTINIDVVAGEITEVSPHLIVPSKKRRLQLFIGYDTTGIQSYKTVLRNSSCSTCIPTYRLRNSYCNITSITIPLTSDFKRANTSTSNDTGGLSVTHSLNCNHRDWLCSISNQMVYPILYKYASLVLEFALTESPNERYNTTDTNNADLLQKRLDLAAAKYSESMDSILQSMRVPQDEKCFYCKETSKHVIAIP